MSGTGLWETRPQGCKQTGRGSIPEGRSLFSRKGLSYQVLASAKAVKLSGSRHQPGQGKGARGWRPPQLQDQPPGRCPRLSEGTKKARIDPKSKAPARKLPGKEADEGES